MDAATSEQAALVLQQLAGENAQIVMQPSEDGTLGTMHATLQNEDGETSIVMVSLTPEQLASANGVTIAEVYRGDRRGRTDPHDHDRRRDRESRRNVRGYLVG
ncbi:putative zinc finger and BTB domain-containing protein 17 [Apostichopus japonicus]|uniref:Putative zinc finger and BTB domain-containing protein 17 n=1 Tax=Stichopus japonicus TaxID=307972 RepID=A0A2G8LKL0_STIJA|nr:putative zinc finger and BTB domain-containing protein 17 [Apostichopus japonicus]